MRTRVFLGCAAFAATVGASAAFAQQAAAPAPAPLLPTYTRVSPNLPELRVTFTDAAWTGQAIPTGQQCRRFQGQGNTPALRVENIPAGANAILLAFNDETYQPMNSGGHGIVGFRITGNSATLAPFPGEVTTGLPQNPFIEAENRSGGFGGPGYLPPCSGGQGNTYSVTVLAVSKSDTNPADNKILAQSKVTLGKF